MSKSLDVDGGALLAQSVRCEHCGYDRAAHHAANLTDGAFVGKYLLICPTVVFCAQGYDVDGQPVKVKA